MKALPAGALKDIAVIVSIFLVGYILAVILGYNIGYKARDAEKAKIGYIVKSVCPLTGNVIEMWIIP